MLHFSALLLVVISITPFPAYAADTCGTTGGEGGNGVELAFDIGCNQSEANPILDMLKAVARFLAGAVGLGLVLAIIIGGIRYMTSAGNPQAVESAKKLIFGAIVGLIIFILAYAILNFLIPS